MRASQSPLCTFRNLLREGRADACAAIRGNTANPTLTGTAGFYATPYNGILIEVEVCGLPYENNGSGSNFYGMHIHENGNCSDDFSMTGNHYDPDGVPHPGHAGDLPPLLGSGGYAYTAFYTSRLSICDIIGRSIIIHGMPDDFVTQPSGNSGGKIACGVIKAMNGHGGVLY